MPEGGNREREHAAVRSSDVRRRPTTSDDVYSCIDDRRRRRKDQRDGVAAGEFNSAGEFDEFAGNVRIPPSLPSLPRQHGSLHGIQPILGPRHGVHPEMAEIGPLPSPNGRFSDDAPSARHPPFATPDGSFLSLVEHTYLPLLRDLGSHRRYLYMRGRWSLK